MDPLAIEETADCTTCDREPIHLSGAIQPHGVLLAVGEADLVVRQASANSAAHLGVEASAAIGASLRCVVGDELVDRLRAALSNPRASGADPLALRLADGSAYEATWHRVDGHLVVELEPAAAPAPVATSTLFEDVRHAMDALQAAEGVQRLCDAAAAELKCLTGYDRVMVYRFDPDEHGEVVAEEREPELEPFLGLHYPASDIPRQARRLYLLNPLRVIADVDYEPIALVRGPESAPLNLGFAGLRSVSPFHLAYLRNMGVGATLSISLMRGPRLWGLLACHHRTPKRLGAQMRAACRLLAQVFSLQVVAWEARERHAYRTSLAEIEGQLVARMSGADDLADALASGSPAPIELTAADGMVARIDGRTVTAGAVPPAPAVEALLARLRARDDVAVFACDDLAHRFGELEPFRAVASGVLAVALSADLEDFILWFRRERIHTVTWGGNPHKPMTGDPLARPGEPGFAQLGPRTSFRAWAQEVRGQSRPWQEAEIDAARALAAAVPELLLARARDRLAHIALHDGLTGLPNRALLSDRIAQALSRPHRRGRRVALLFVDLDRFKLVNDSLGHAAGDVLLRQAADRLSAATRDADTVARLGGDEFVVLCEDIDPARAEQIAQRIVDAFRAPFVLDGHGTVVTASVGVAIADAHATAAQLLRDADTAMYRVKHGGRNAAAPFTRSLRAISLRRVEIETGLRPALENGDLRLHFQPVHTVRGALTGLEALVRWPLPGRGMVPPTEFVAVAEETGLIAPLTAWALDDGLAALARWRRRRPELDLTLSINISPTQMTPALHGVVGDALARHALPPAALCLEITERALVADDAGSRRLLGDLRDQGVRLSIDDFGNRLLLAGLPQPAPGPRDQDRPGVHRRPGRPPQRHDRRRLHRRARAPARPAGARRRRRDPRAARDHPPPPLRPRPGLPPRPPHARAEDRPVPHPRAGSPRRLTDVRFCPPRYRPGACTSWSARRSAPSAGPWTSSGSAGRC